MGEGGWEQTTAEGAVLTCFHFQLYRELMCLKTLANLKNICTGQIHLILSQFITPNTKSTVNSGSPIELCHRPLSGKYSEDQENDREASVRLIS